YAVLSHRWSDDELSLQDMEQSHRRTESHGWWKLSMFCKQAAEQGIRFAWIDTCCIDKTSSAELDESIRSMFRWYQNSTTCIIHLAQTTSLEHVGGDEWFRRGWTLQELLAPNVIQLQGAAWQTLAPAIDKLAYPYEAATGPLSHYPYSLYYICEAVGMSVESFLGFSPSPTCVDQRMVWAANRDVTRGEDTAYSLMGIFDVSISTAYGEGAERAFCRLVEAIMMAGDLSVLNWSGP
ncbi:HET-domain-containing protein, partial [Coniophora puteana RWD-64-598 SS2]